MTTIGFTDNYPHEGSYVVYLNGIEVPVQAVEVSMGTNAIPSAVLEMVPDPVIQRIGAEDRLEVAVFYLDDIYPDINKKGSSPDFRLLYEGEVTGWSYTNSSLGRRIGLNSLGFLKILSDLYPYYITGIESLALKEFGAAEGEAATFVTNPKFFPWSRFFYGFDTTKNKLIRRPYDLFMNIIAACTGVKEQAVLGSVVSTNFFARYMARVVFMNRFLPSPLIETDILKEEESESGSAGVFPILAALRESDAFEAVVRDALQHGANNHIWGTLQQMFLRMYYETLVITTAPIAQVERAPDSKDNGVVLGPPRFKIAEDPDKKAERATLEKEILEKRIAKSQRLVEEQITAAETFPDPNDPTKTIEVTESNLQSLIDAYKVKIRNELEAEAAQEPEDTLRPNCILNYVTKPQWLFGVAPACNVIFPSIVQEFRFEENYAAQPTRMYINDMWYSDHTAGNDPVQQAVATLRAGYPEQVQLELNKRYGISEAGISGDPTVSGKNFLVWPEEFFKGPRTESIRLPNWFTMLAQYTQTKQTAEQKKAANALKELKSLIGKKEDSATIQAKIKEFIAAGILPPQVLKSGAKDTAGQVYNNSVVEKILEKLASEKMTAMEALRRGYARYEYYRQRFQYRSGAVITAFNPYIVPGFPAFIFDELASGNHVVGYVVGVTHSLRSDSWTTQVNFTFGMTLDEFMQELFDARTGNTPFGVLENQAAAPVHPIEPLRTILQDQERAEEYFSLLFHRRANYPGIKSCAFDFNKAIRLVLPSGETFPFLSALEAEAVQQEVAKRKKEQEEAYEKIEKAAEEYGEKLLREQFEYWGGVDSLDAITVQAIKDDVAAKTANFRERQHALWESARAEKEKSAPTAKLPSDLLQKYIGVVPSKAFAPMFRNHANAMRFIARPICTLDEYVAFRGRRGAKIGKISPANTVQGKGGVFYEKILNLKQGPGDPPTFDQNNNMLTPDIKDFPDTRADWETRLKSYRQKVLFKKAGWRAEEP